MIRRAREWARARLVPGSLRSQLLVRSLFILAALLLLIGALQYWLMKDFLYQSRAEGLRAQAMSVPMGLLKRQEEAPGLDARTEVGSDTGSSPANPNPDQDDDADKPRSQSGMNQEGRPFVFRDISLALIDSEGNYTDVSGEFGMQSPQLAKTEYAGIAAGITTGHKERRAPDEYRIVQDSTGTEQLVVFSPLRHPGQPGSLIQMGTSTEPLKEQLLQQLLIFVVLSCLALAGGILLYIPVLRRTLVPLSRMVEVVQQTDAGNLAERLPVSQGQVEIDRLSRSFNGMLERLEHSFEAERESKELMRQFIADASHELRTPLTSIHGFLEVLLRGAADNPEKLHAALTSMHGESRRINKLVEDLLLLTKLDQAPQLQSGPLRLDALLREMQPQLLMLAGNRTVRLDVTADVTVCADPDKMKQVVLNLFHNAVQHTLEDGGLITLSLHASKEQVDMRIQDNGSGIDPQHLLHIFDRFYRSESSRTRKSGGAGLGLSITKSIVEAHHGTIRAESTPGEGTCFHITLPSVN
ncbi:sensor histidine kinase [Paenibacillus tuaregi]|uniref:sensor histidine kinase n=1 Tax=Paenibacillus tuaregi TaxID=1816681 RepID=UPI0008393A52|nr:HAMP domain-containing sensor histidine kinase [Paenibacillus tuaregi]